MAGFSTTKRNVLSSLLGKCYVAVLSFVFVPIYLRLLGAEAYGLIGLYVSMQVIASLLDMGLSPTLTRELARLSAAPGNEQESRNLVRTLEAVYWLIGGLLGAGTALLSPWIAQHLAHGSRLSQGSIVQSLALIGLIMVFQWPDSFYSGGLMGLQRQTTLNLIRMGIATLQGVGALAILHFYSCTIQAYFGWLAAVYALQTALLVVCLWKTLPASAARASFQKELRRKNAKFMAGITGVAFTAILLTQIDKVIVATSLPLAVFGYYTLATNSANSLTIIVSPIFAAVFPRYSQLAALEDEAGMSRFYHQSCQLLSLIIFPIGVTGFLFSRALLTLYLHNPQSAAQVDPIFRLLLVAITVNSLQLLPHGLQLAYGWTRLPLMKNLAGLVFYLPLMLVVVPRYGTMGAASLWLALNMVYVALEMPFMHRRLLKGEMARWYLSDVGLPLAIALAVGSMAYYFAPARAAWPWQIAWILLSCVVGMAANLAAMPRLWRSLLHREPLPSLQTAQA